MSIVLSCFLTQSVDGRYVLPEGTKQRIIETQERTRAAAAARPESAPRRSRSKSVRAQAHERVAEDARKVAANALIGMSRRGEPRRLHFLIAPADGLSRSFRQLVVRARLPLVHGASLSTSNHARETSRFSR